MGYCCSRAFSALRVLLIVPGALFNGVAFAQAATSTLTLDAAIARALADNPGLRAAGYDVEIARARHDAAALTTPLVVGAEIENFAGTDSLGGFDRSETTLQLSKVLERGDRPSLRSALGDARVALAETESRVARLDVGAEVTRRFVRIVVDQKRLVLAEQATDIARELLGVVERRYEAGRSSEAELATAEIALAQAELERATIERGLDSDRVSLATLWGDTRADFARARGALFELPGVEAFESVQERIAQSPDMLRLASEQRIAEAQQRLAESRRRADLSVAFGLRHLAAPDDTAFTVSASLPLGARSRAVPSISEATAQRARLPEVIAQRRLDLHAVAFELHTAMELARERFVTIEESLIPRSERAVALYRAGFELGSYSLLELTQAQRELLSLRSSALAAASDFHLTLIDIEQLLGGIDLSGASQ
jgi:cobalt-zinc-cadmium efflux system outer membrane protein